MTAGDTIMMAKERIFDSDPSLYVLRQRLVYRPGPHGMEALADDETLGNAGVAQDGSAVFDVELVDLKEMEAFDLGSTVWH